MSAKSTKNNLSLPPFCEFYYIFALFTHGIYTLTEQRNEKTDLLSCVDVPADWSSCRAG
jgi:hypothetical protein